MRLRSSSPEQTRAIARAVAELVQAGDLIVLAGELGAGKTVFAQGLLRALGVDEPVVSPSFTLVREYHGRLPVAHVDLYRIERVQEFIDLALDEGPGSRGLTVVEWGDRVGSALGPDRLEVRLERPPVVALAGAPEIPDEHRGDDAVDDERVVMLTAYGVTWYERLTRFSRALDAHVHTTVLRGG